MNTNYRIMAWLLHAVALSATTASIVRPGNQYVAVAALLASAYTHRQQTGAGADPFGFTAASDLVGSVTAELVARRRAAIASRTSTVVSTPAANRR